MSFFFLLENGITIIKYPGHFFLALEVEGGRLGRYFDSFDTFRYFFVGFFFLIPEHARNSNNPPFISRYLNCENPSKEEGEKKENNEMQ